MPRDVGGIVMANSNICTFLSIVALAAAAGCGRTGLIFIGGSDISGSDIGGSDATPVVPDASDASAEVVRPRDACVSACPLRATQCGPGGGQQACIDVDGCGAWGPEAACPAPKTCQGIASGASCECPARPAACTGGAGTFCESSSVVATCTMGTEECVSITARTTCSMGNLCTVSHPNAVCMALPPVPYDDFNDNTLNPVLWTVVQSGIGPTITETNQRLEISHPASSMDGPGAGFGAQYTSVCFLRGDFDIQVDYQLLIWPFANGVRLGIVMALGATERVSLGTTIDFPGQPREAYVAHFRDNILNFISTSDLSGKLRQVRSGSTVTGYYFRSGNWLAIHSSPATTVDMRFSLASWSAGYAFTKQAVKLAFDNVIVNQGKLICP